MLFHHYSTSSVMASEHPSGIGLKLQPRGNVGWGQDLEFYVPQTTESLRIIGEILEGYNQLQNIHRAKQFFNIYIIQSDPKATLDVCSLLNNVGFISFERLDLQSSKVPLYFRESTSLLQQKSVIVGEWNSSFLKFSLFLRNLTNWICSNFFRTIYKANDDKTDFFFFYKRLRRKKLLYSLGIKNRVWLLVSFSCINLLFLSSTMSNVKSKWNGGIYVFYLKGLA